MANLVKVFGLCALLLGSAGYLLVPRGLEMYIKSIINLDESGVLTQNYFKPADDDGNEDEQGAGDDDGGEGVPSAYYLFAITNAAEVLKGSKASFEVKGPYWFKKVAKRKMIKFSEQNQKVAYETKNFILLNELNSADLDEEMWLVNPVQLTLVSSAQSLVLDRIPFKRLAGPLVFNGLDIALGSFGESLILRTTPRKLLLGRRIGIFAALSSVSLLNGLKSYMPSNIFGLAVAQNKSVSQSEIWTGVGKTREKFADVTKHKGQDKMDAWRDQRCNAISGTNGELYKPFPKRNKPIPIFLGGLCRSLHLDPVDEHKQLVVTESGMKTYEYELSGSLYRGMRSRPENECFCVDSQTYDCQYDGLMAMGPCFSGAPIYLAQANFKDVDPKIRDLVDWRSLLYLNSTDATGQRRRMAELQRVRMDPLTGLVMEYEMTMMILFKVVRNKGLEEAKNIQPLTYMPLFAISEKFKVPEEKVWPLRVLQSIYQNQGLVTLSSAAVGACILFLNQLFGY